jgi:hypothetical protein
VIRLRALLGLTLVVLFGAGCSDRLRGATELAQAVLEARKANDVDRSLTAYGPTFYAHVSRDTWRAKLIETGRAAGQIEAYELAAWSSQYSVGWGRTGEVVQLKYRVRYARRAGDEVFVIFRPWFIGDIQLAGHHIVVTPERSTNSTGP